MLNSKITINHKLTFVNPCLYSLLFSNRRKLIPSLLVEEILFFYHKLLIKFYNA